ncbi:MAG: SMP-30/gluconolactonase/LRE family protein [bacterium]|nr:SMP-30/gluconolactonase/LRE family protein [bacterium]
MQVNLDVRDERIWQLIDADVEIEQIATGFRFLEGPIWHPYTQNLLFSDILGNGIYRWSERDGISLFRANSYMANGNSYDLQGNILSCEHATSRVTRTKADGSYEVLASHYNGKQLNSPNDIVVKSDGTIYFTDPASGRSAGYGVPREQELPFQGVYRLNPEESSLSLLVDDFSKPNGLCFSLDETRLFINDTDRQHIRVFDVNADGTPANGKLWAELPEAGKDRGVADGMKFDTAGHLLCSGPGGIQIFDENAVCLGRILMPEFPANFTWGGEDMRSVFMTATTSVYRLKVNVPGRKLF